MLPIEQLSLTSAPATFAPIQIMLLAVVMLVPALAPTATLELPSSRDAVASPGTTRQPPAVVQPLGRSSCLDFVKEICQLRPNRLKRKPLNGALLRFGDNCLAQAETL